MKRMIFMSIGVLAFLYLVGLAGNIEHTQEIILDMSYEDYISIRNELRKKGEGTSDKDIATEYEHRKTSWDESVEQQ